MKISREDWLARGLKLLAAHGPDVIKIDRLCGHLKVTKGSFYHYFANRQAFIDELLAFWLKQDTEDIITSLADIADPGARSDALNAIIHQSDLRPEMALRFWGREEPAVAEVVALVDQRRLDYLTRLISEQTGSVDQASVIAKLAYAHFVGCQVLGDLVNQEEWVSMDRLLNEMVLNQLGGNS
jgi:AcrR family transcriptional regulator